MARIHRNGNMLIRLDSIEIDVYFNTNKEKPDFDYERFVNDFRTSLTQKLLSP